MARLIGSITRTATRKDNEKLNVLTFPTHERYQNGLANTNAIYWMYRCPEVKDWNDIYGKMPKNHILLNPSKKEKQIPPEVDFDLILSQNKFGQFNIAKHFSKTLNLPIISLEHTLPLPNWSQKDLTSLKNMRGDLNLFISEYSMDKWGWSKEDKSVRTIHHGIDTELFSPNENMVDKKNQVLSVVNDWINRDVFCGFKLWQESTVGVPIKVVGNTPGLSSPAKNIHDLVMQYRQSKVFLNTSLVSPIPTALLEAMSCGCAVVSTENCMIPEIIKQGKNGFMSNDPKELKDYCNLLLSSDKLCKELGDNARKTIQEHFSMNRFVNDWNSILNEAINIPYNELTFNY